MDVRAVENIAAAPASATDRRAALISVVALVAFFVGTLPLARLRPGEVPAFLPAVIGASVVALIVTALLLYLQYRIERDPRLALLFVAYGFAAATQLLYVLTFPRLFAPTGLLGAGPQTSSWFFLSSQIGFALIVLAQALAARWGGRLDRTGVRIVALGSLAVLVGHVAVLHARPRRAAGHRRCRQPLGRPQPAASSPPRSSGCSLVALVVGGGRWRTVTEVWLTVVLLARAIDVFTAGAIGAHRFSLGWYAARLEGLVAAVVVLAVFLVKYNGLMLRLAARTRSTAEALEIGEARYASLANVVPQLIFTTRADGEVEYVNDRWTAYTGLDLSATRSAGWRSPLHPDHELAVRDRWLHALRTRRAVRGRVPHARGERALPLVPAQRRAGAGPGRQDDGLDRHLHRRRRAEAAGGARGVPGPRRRAAGRLARRQRHGGRHQGAADPAPGRADLGGAARRGRALRADRPGQHRARRRARHPALDRRAARARRSTTRSRRWWPAATRSCSTSPTAFPTPGCASCRPARR